MLYKGIIAVCYEIHTKHIYKPCGQKLGICYIRLLVPLGSKVLKICYKNQLVNAV
jgi:hypothetical protein